MIGMTEKAAKKMKEMLAGGTATTGMRIDVRGNPCRPSYRFTLVDRPDEGDFRIEEEGIRIYFDPIQAANLFNVEIDHNGSPDEKGFLVKRLTPCS